MEEKLFEKNGVNVEMKWFDGYVQSMDRRWQDRNFLVNDNFCWQ